MSDLVPRRTERMLEALGADTEFRDAVIGDLAEEFAIRAEMDGVSAARRWYYRESLRVAPYLVRDWWRGLTTKDAWYFTRVVGISSVALYLYERVMGLTVHSIDPGLRSLWDAMSDLGEARVILFPAVMLVWTLIDGVFGGYVAARLGRRAPLASALALGAVWVVFLVVGMAQSSGVLLVMRALNALPLLAGIIAGGMLGATRESTFHDGAAVDMRGVEGDN